MHTHFSTGIDASDDGTAAGRAAAEAAAEKLEAPEAEFCQVFCSSTYDEAAVVAAVRDVVGTDAELFGCSSGGEFTEDGVTDAGVAVSLLASDELRFFTGIGTRVSENVTRAVREAVNELPQEVGDFPFRSAIVLHDGLAGVGEQLTLIAQQKLGPHVSFAGGAAADDHRMEETNVFRGDEVVSDAVGIALVASTERPIISVDHGHEPISEPLEVTRSEGNVVHELDGRPAFEAWRDVVREPAREEFGVDVDAIEEVSPALEEIMGPFEFGIDQGDQYKIRWPQVNDVDEGTIQFAVDVPEGTVFHVMYGTRESQVESARRAARTAVEDADGEVAGAFVYDCACRSNILGDEFETAVEAMGEEFGAPFAGFETYGEICMQPGQMSGFHNTTTVILLFPG